MKRMQATVQSPCNDVCRIDEVSGWCLGCWRTIDEIAAWASATDDARRAVLAELPARRQSVVGQGAPAAARREEAASR